MGETLVRKGCRDYPIVLVCSDDRLVVEAEDERCTVRITNENHLPDEDQNVYRYGESRVKTDTATKILKLGQKIRCLWLLLAVLILSIIHSFCLIVK